MAHKYDCRYWKQTCYMAEGYINQRRHWEIRQYMLDVSKNRTKGYVWWSKMFLCCSDIVERFAQHWYLNKRRWSLLSKVDWKLISQTVHLQEVTFLFVFYVLCVSVVSVLCCSYFDQVNSISVYFLRLKYLTILNTSESY